MYYRYLLYIKDNTKYAYLKNYLIRCYLIVYVIVFKFNKIDYIAHIITLAVILKRMNRNEEKFEQIQNLLIEKLGNKIECSQDEDGTKYVNIKNSNFWLSTTGGEFVVGFGLNHTHFSDEYDNLENGIFQALDLITNKIKTTNYIKGNTIFKTTIEIQYENSKSLNIGTSSIIIYPFWRKTRIETEITDKILNKKEIEKQANLILNFDNKNLLEVGSNLN